ncbi:MAG: right-handed parallel beta-helix repeat-containing protein [Streptosporangiales bacterium]|nr:right-handed parallel beta-helix repeat-containing protein [Streptosporangiales bacterium]
MTIRSRIVVLVAVLAVALGVVLLGAVRTPDDGGKAARPTASDPTTPPAQPLARVCGNRDALDGPRRPPAGAVTVGTDEPLDDVAGAHPPGTTFWLETGVHKLGTGKFDQIEPEDGDTYIGAPGAVLDGQRRNSYAFTGSASAVTVAHLTVQNFGASASNNDEGVVNHDAAPGWTIRDNTVRRNAGAGVMLGSRNVLRGNCLSDNGQYGFSAYHPDGVRQLTLAGNEVVGNNTDDWERRRPGCGCSGGGKFWEVTGADVRANWVHDNRGAGLWADTNNAGFTIERNYIAHNDAEGVFYEASYNAAIRYNTFARNGRVKGKESASFPTGAIYLSEAGSDSRVKTRHSAAFEITGNLFLDNWSGVILWENADRFVGSPANTSTGSSTLVNPDTVTAETCNRKNIRKKPYYDDCRWKTQNVRVHDNDFRLTRRAVGNTCTADTGCGYNGVFANWGTYPAWSPYRNDVIQERIVFEQDNRFFANRYRGPWQFAVGDQGTRVPWSSWRAAPYRQDEGSVHTPKSGSSTGD